MNLHGLKGYVIKVLFILHLSKEAGTVSLGNLGIVLKVHRLKITVMQNISAICAINVWRKFSHYCNVAAYSRLQRTMVTVNRHLLSSVYIVLLFTLIC